MKIIPLTSFSLSPSSLSLRVSDDPHSSVHGVVTADGLFEGHIVTGDGQQYVIERAARYFDLTPDFHSVIYREEDVVMNTINASLCQSDRLHDRLFEKQKNMTISQKPPTAKSSSKSVQPSLDLLDHAKSRYTSQYHVPGRHKRGIDNSKTTCTLYVQADHLFYRKFGSNQETVIEQLTQHVQGVNEIYKIIGKEM